MLRLLRYAIGFSGSKILPSKNFSTPRLSDAGAATPRLLADARHDEPDCLDDAPPQDETAGDEEPTLF